MSVGIVQVTHNINKYLCEYLESTVTVTYICAMKELKTKRVEFKMLPSLHAKATKKADKTEVSLGEYINSLIEADLNKRKP